MTELIMMKIIFIFFLDDVHGYIEENDGIKYLVFTSTNKNKEPLKIIKELWEETKRQSEGIKMRNQLNTEKTSSKLTLDQTMACPWVKHLIFLT